MKNIYAPWRQTYSTGKGNGKSACPFCIKNMTEQDTENFVIKRYEHCFVMLNIHPYNPGHVLIIPYDHTANITMLPSHVRYEIMEVMTAASHILETNYNTDGINIGLNQGGKAAGGTVPEHLHFHVLPRWLGDTNFLATIGHTKLIAANLQDVYKILKDLFLQHHIK